MVEHFDIEEYLDALRSSRKFGPQVVCSKAFARRGASYAKPRSKLDRRLQEGLTRLGIERLYTHQAEALDLIQQGSDVLVATPTASGKSLIYNLPVLDTYLRQPHAHYLYLFPLKALAQDQLRTLQKLYTAVTGTEDGRAWFQRHI